MFCGSFIRIKTFIIVDFAGHGNLQYYHIGVLSYWNIITLKFSCIGIITFIIVAAVVLELENSLWLPLHSTET